MDLFILVTCTVAITYAMGMHTISIVIIGCLEYLFLLALSHVGIGADILPTAAGWLFANEKVLKRLAGVQDKLQLQLKALQDSVLLRSLQEQDIIVMIRQLRSEVNALMEGAKLRGEDLDFQRLRVS